MIRSFPLLQPHFQVEAEQLNLQYPDPAEITAAADKLRWYRHRKALLQRGEVGFLRVPEEKAGKGKLIFGITEPDKLEKIAQILEVDMMELMDEYNLFLYHNQGRQIRAKREALGMTVVQYAKHLGVQDGKLRRWESNQVQISKATWERYFK